MQKKAKIMHTSFSPWEWITLKGGEFLFEDGYTVDPDLFWLDRQGKEWEIGWDYFPE